MLYFSAVTGGFYRDGYHQSIPEDAKQVSDEVFDSLFSVPLPAGKKVGSDAAGLPVLVDIKAPAPPTVEQIQAMRLSAYREESDQLKIEAEHDALLNGVAPDYASWMAKVAEIKERYPLPE